MKRRKPTPDMPLTTMTLSLCNAMLLGSLPLKFLRQLRQCLPSYFRSPRYCGLLDQGVLRGCGNGKYGPALGAMES